MSRVARCAKRPEDASKNTRTACGQRQRRRYLRRQRSPEHDCWDDANDGDNGFSGSWGALCQQAGGALQIEKAGAASTKNESNQANRPLKEAVWASFKGRLLCTIFYRGYFAVSRRLLSSSASAGERSSASARPHPTRSCPGGFGP